MTVQPLDPRRLGRIPPVADAQYPERAAAASHCEPWCAGPSDFELAAGRHVCPPELTEHEVDALQLETLAAELAGRSQQLDAVLSDVKRIVGEQCVMHGEDGALLLDVCPWCRLVKLTAAVR